MIQGSAIYKVVVIMAHYQICSPPSMRIRHFNVNVIAWSNLKPGIHINGRRAVFNANATIDVVNVSGGVDVTFVTLRENERKGEGVIHCEHRCDGDCIAGCFAWDGFRV